MALQASKKYGLLLPVTIVSVAARATASIRKRFLAPFLLFHHKHIASWASNGIDSEQVPGTFSMFTISSRSSQASAQGEKWFLPSYSLECCEGSYPNRRLNSNTWPTHSIRGPATAGSITVCSGRRDLAQKTMRHSSRSRRADSESGQFTANQEGGMKATSYLFFTGLMIVVLLLLYADPAAAWPTDNMPHVGLTSACAAPLPSGTHLGQNFTFLLCVGSSQATTWSITVFKLPNGPVLPCSISGQPVSINKLNCTNIPTGTYSVTVSYMVGTSPGPTHSDRLYSAP